MATGICKDCSKLINWESDKNGGQHPRNSNGKTHGCIARRLGEKKLNPRSQNVQYKTRAL